MKTIVVLTGYGGHLEDKSWMCHSPGEAERMAKWLESNHVEAEALTIEEWNDRRSKE